MADENDVRRVGVEFLRISRIANVGDGGLHVFDGVGEGEVAGRAPGAAVVEVDDVPTGAADGLGEVEIFFVAGEAVEEKYDFVGSGSGCDIGDGVEQSAVAWDLECFEGGGVGLVGRGICGDGCGKLLRVKGSRKYGTG